MGLLGLEERITKHAQLARHLPARRKDEEEAAFAAAKRLARHHRDKVAAPHPGLSQIRRQRADAGAFRLPAATRIAPKLTTWTAIGIATIMVLASGFHGLRGEFGALPIKFILGGIAVFIAAGPTFKSPIRSRF